MKLFAHQAKTVKTLLWEQWRQARPILAGTVGVAAVAAMLVFTIGMLDPTFTAMIPAEGWFFVMPFLALLALPLTESEGGRLGPNLPPRILALPVTTRSLTAACFGFRLVAVAVLSCCVSVIAQVALGSGDRIAPVMLQDFGGPMAWPPLMIASYCFVQASLWLLGPIHFAVAALVIFFLGINLMNRYIAFIANNGAYSVPTLAVLAAAIAVFYSIGHLAIALERRSILSSVRGRLLGLFERRARSARSFSSAQEAVYWFEWRRRGRVLPVTTLILFLSLLAALTQGGTRSIDGEEYLMACFVCLLGGAITAGLANALLDFRDRNSGFATFTMSRCIDTKSMARQRLRATTRSVVTTYALLALGLIPLAALGGLENQLTLTSKLPAIQWQSYLLLFVLAVLGHATLTWALVASFPFLALPLLFGWGVFVLAASLNHGLHLVPEDAAAAMAATVWFASIAVFYVALFAITTRRNQRSSSFSLAELCRKGSVLLWILGCVPSLFLIVFVSEVRAGTSVALWPAALLATTCLAATMASCAPLVLTPVWLRKLRHG